jgi:hypothetical protein
MTHVGLQRHRKKNPYMFVSALQLDCISSTNNVSTVETDLQ